jgi:hypothetical protein
MKKNIHELIGDQERWIQEHGGSLAGYVERYGSKDDAKHFGDGGEAIYAADWVALQNLKERARRKR